MLSSKKEMGFHRPLYVFGGTMSHLTNLLISFFSGYSPCSPCSPW
nr:MAG TPA: hypothetical protein [Caudoviricetes sp.]